MTTEDQIAQRLRQHLTPDYLAGVLMDVCDRESCNYVMAVEMICDYLAQEMADDVTLVAASASEDA